MGLYSFILFESIFIGNSVQKIRQIDHFDNG